MKKTVKMQYRICRCSKEYSISVFPNTPILSVPVFYIGFSPLWHRIFIFLYSLVKFSFSRPLPLTMSPMTEAGFSPRPLYVTGEIFKCEYIGFSRLGVTPTDLCSLLCYSYAKEKRANPGNLWANIYFLISVERWAEL